MSADRGIKEEWRMERITELCLRYGKWELTVFVERFSQSLVLYCFQYRLFVYI